MTPAPYVDDIAAILHYIYTVTTRVITKCCHTSLLATCFKVDIPVGCNGQMTGRPDVVCNNRGAKTVRKSKPAVVRVAKNFSTGFSSVALSCGFTTRKIGRAHV